MKLEDYFEFLAEDDIRIKGTRVGIESVLYDYVYRNQTTEEIVRNFASLKIEQVYATILYYLSNREEIEKYLLNWLSFGKKAREKQEENPPPVVLRLRKVKSEKTPIAA
jgi:uncharacterized protein (DUF433 family)